MPLIFTIVTFVIFLLTSPYFTQVEFGVYSSYTESIVEDGDFNLVDEMFFPGQKIATTKTGYYPNFHSHASTIMWIPFYAYGKFLSEVFDLPEVRYDKKQIAKEGKLYKPFEEDDHSERFIKQMALTLSTCFYSVLAFIMIFLYVRQRKKSLSLFWSLTLFAAIASPLTYYVLYEPGNGTINALFLSFLSYLFYKEIRDSNNIWKWAALGLFQGVAFAIKVDTVFYTLLVGDLIYNEIILKRKFEKLSNIFLYSIGFAIALILQFTNIYSILGVLSYGYSSIALLNFSVLFDTYFSSYQGVFVNGPFYLFVLIISLFYIRSLKELSLNTFLFLAILAKMLTYGLTYSHGSGIFGGRQLIPEIPFFILLLLNFYETKIKDNSLFKPLFLGSGVVGSLWCFYLMLIYIGQQEGDLGEVPFTNVFEYYFGFLSEPAILWKIFLKYVFKLYFPLIKLTNFIPAFLGIFAVYYFIFKVRVEKLCLLVTIFISSSYLVITLANQINGKKNISELRKQGYYKTALVGSGPLYSVYYENLGSVEERILFLREKNRPEELAYYEELYKQIQRDIHKDIISFPEGESRDIRSYFREFDSHERIDKLLKL